MMLSKSFLWTAALGLPLLIIAESIDFGGILPWSHWMSAVVSVALGIVAWAGYGLQHLELASRRHSVGNLAGELAESTFSALVPAIALLVATGYLCLQSVELPESWVAWLSPASADAFMTWGDVADEAIRRSFTISIDSDATQHVASMLLGLSAFAVAAAFALQSPRACITLLCCVAIAGAGSAAYGLIRMASGDFYVWNAKIGGFGFFANRNASALWMNFSVAASIGLIANQSMIKFGREVDDPEYEITDWIGLMSDPIAVVGAVSGFLSIAGLLSCGSRGGIVAMILGLSAATGWIRRGRGFKTVPLLAFLAVIATAILVIPFRLSMNSLSRFSVFRQTGTGTLAEDGRLRHWQDAFEAAKHYFPAGSGAGTYGDAYRPFQDKSPGLSFFHADNLWLEWVVEMGGFAVVAIIAIFGFFIFHLRRLRDSEDPIDHGLRAAGWFAIVSAASAECFNFGLLYLCNAMFLIAIAAAIAARSSQCKSQDSQQNDARKRLPIFSRLKKPLLILVPALSLVGCLSTITVLRIDAIVDTAIRARQNEGVPSTFSSTQLDRWIDRLSKIPSTAIVEAELSSLYFNRGRQLDLANLDARSTAESLRFRQAMQATYRRVLWRDSREVIGPRPLTTASVHEYDKMIESAKQAIRQRPLAIEPRNRIIAGDFFHRDVDYSRKVYDETEKLIRNNPGELFKLGQYAAGSQDTGRAFRTWNRAMILEPKFVPRVLEQVFCRQLNRADWNEPDDTFVGIQATKWLISRTDPDPILLKKFRKHLSCSQSLPMAKKSECLRVSAEVDLYLGETESGFKNYRAAVEADPLNLELRLQQIRRLKEYDRSSEVNAAARKANQVFPSEERFSNIFHAEQFEATDFE